MFLSLIQQRRSIRRYQQRPVEPEKVELLIEAALRAPSSRSLNPWEFIVISDSEILAEVAAAKAHGSAFIKGAPLGIVVCADPDRCDVWIEDAAIAATYIQLTAESLGLGSCWIQIREREHSPSETAEGYLQRVLGLPESLKVLAVIAIGYPDEKLPPHEHTKLQYEKVFYNHYGKR